MGVTPQDPRNCAGVISCRLGFGLEVEFYELWVPIDRAVPDSLTAENRLIARSDRRRSESCHRMVSRRFLGPTPATA